MNENQVRAVAFLITSGKPDSLTVSATQHLRKLAELYNLDVIAYNISSFKVLLVTDNNGRLNEACADFTEIRIGDLSSATEEDRFLAIALTPSQCVIRNDYAGSIPVFYSNKYGLVLSNIEPCVVLATNSSDSDFSPENIYGYLQFSHFIWDETAWRHINQMLPDSRYTFGSNGNLIHSEYLQSVRASDSRVSLSDSRVSAELHDLNVELVGKSLQGAETIILPLSAGYDSRIILAAIDELPSLKQKTVAYSYGAPGAIDTEVARALALLVGIPWQYIDLPCRFLGKRVLEEIADIFGSSMHMHGMYQLEFLHEISRLNPLRANTVITSGFMTGVPAGQHDSHFDVTNADSSLMRGMLKFPQSQAWSKDALESIPLLSECKEYEAIARARFQSAFDRFQGEPFQKAVMCDVWTRQRNFISYYPRTLEWQLPTRSPHMSPRYANFFMSLRHEHLKDRKAIELMLKNHHKRLAKVLTNSNGIKSIAGLREKLLVEMAQNRSLKQFRTYLPKRFHFAHFEFDVKAVKNCGETAFYPFLETNSKRQRALKCLGGETLGRELYTKTRNGCVKSYMRFVCLQSLAISVLHFAHKNNRLLLKV